MIGIFAAYCPVAALRDRESAVPLLTSRSNCSKMCGSHQTLATHGLKCIGNGKGLLIWSFGCQRIKNIDNLQHPGGNRDSVSSKPIWITGAVELLVMMTNDGKN